MMTSMITYSKIFFAMIVFGFLASGVRADQSVLDRFVGSWKVRVKTLQPVKPDISYTEKYEWVLDHTFLHGMTGRKPDGTQDLIYATYDSQAKGSPFWVFSSSGTYIYLPPATWNKRKHMMEWKSPGEWDIIYRGQCLFPNENIRNCSMIMKDWKGNVLLEQTWTATRLNR